MIHTNKHLYWRWGRGDLSKLKLKGSFSKGLTSIRLQTLPQKVLATTRGSQPVWKPLVAISTCGGIS